MKNNPAQKILRRALPLVLTALILLVTLISCTPEVDYGDSIKLSDQFMDHVTLTFATTGIPSDPSRREPRPTQSSPSKGTPPVRAVSRPSPPLIR